MNIEQYVVKCKVQLKVQLKWVEYLEVVNKLEYVLQVDRITQELRHRTYGTAQRQPNEQ